MNFSMVFSAVLEQFGSLLEVLAFFGTLAGAQWLFGQLEARVLENWVAWHNFPSWVKKIVPMVLAVGIASASQLAINYNVEQYIPEWFAVILLSVINQLSNQKAYQDIKDSSYGESARAEAAEYLG